MTGRIFLFLYLNFLIHSLIGTLPTFSIAEDLSQEKVSEVEPQELSDVQRFFNEGKAYISGRYRFENVNQEGLPKNANASTLRTRLGIDTGRFYKISGKLEFEDVSVIGNDLYNSTVNGQDEYPIVADPDSTEVNQAYISLDAIPDTVVRGGREAVNLDNVRFIGDVDWRQNNQTYDGANITNQSLTDLRLFYGYVENVNRIFGDDSPIGDYRTNLNLFNIHYSGVPNTEVITYAYLLDVEESPESSSTSLGFHISGDYQIVEDTAIIYDGEYAYQEDFENNPINYSAQYWRSKLGVKNSGVTMYAAFESLGSDEGNIGFSTPFATAHAWNGWADQFVKTPPDGLNDAFSGVNYTITELGESIDRLAFDAIYHYFSAEQENTKYGSEWDFNAAISIFTHFLFGVQYAAYESTSFSTDTEKLTFTLQAIFTQ